MILEQHHKNSTRFKRNPFQSLLFESKCILTSSPLLLFKQARAIDGVELPFEATVFYIQHAHLSAQSDSRNMFRSFGLLAKNIVVRARLEMMDQLLIDLDGIGDVVENIVYHQTMWDAETYRIHYNIYALLSNVPLANLSLQFS